MTKEHFLQDLVEEFASLEAGIAASAARVGALPAAIDTVARGYNADGFSVRACEAGPAHLCIGDAFASLMKAQSDLMAAHQFLIEKACQCEPPIPLPQPRAGGR